MTSDERRAYWREWKRLHRGDRGDRSAEYAKRKPRKERGDRSVEYLRYRNAHPCLKLQGERYWMDDLPPELRPIAELIRETRLELRKRHG